MSRVNKKRLAYAGYVSIQIFVFIVLTCVMWQLGMTFLFSLMLASSCARYMIRNFKHCDEITKLLREEVHEIFSKSNG